MTTPAAEFYRLDPLTGSNNFLSFVEALNLLSAQEQKSQFSILDTDLNSFNTLNETRGHAYGDSLIRWLDIVLREECNAPTYRLGGDEFTVILTDGLHTDHEELLHRLYDRLNREGEQLGIPTPAATIALIQFDARNDFSINDVIFHLWETIYDLKVNKDRTTNIYRAQNLIQPTANAERQKHNHSEYASEYAWSVLRYIANTAVSEIVGMGRALDDAQKSSFLDSISGLPNLRAALQKMEMELNNAAQARQSLSILMIDGDNIKRYNSVSYADGDKMIQDMAAVLSENLRPGDFVARWRTGDEFMVILPNTSGQGARVVGERFCTAIREASKNWLFPTSISIGIATYPKHGEHVNALVDAAEAANKQAKDEGKDRVILAD
jgi:diguanylate cyclase (GGDEF)-like protein